MPFTPEQLTVVRNAERLILSPSTTDEQVADALMLVDSLGIKAVSANFRHMIWEWRGRLPEEPQYDKAVRPDAPPPTVSNPKADLKKAPDYGTLCNFDSNRAKMFVDRSMTGGAKVETKDLGVLPDVSTEHYKNPQAQTGRFVVHSPANGKRVYHHIVSDANTTQHTLSLSPNPSDHPLSYVLVNHYKDLGGWNGVPTIGISYSGSNSGYGLGLRLYREALKHHGKLQSDQTTSVSANGVWRKLLASPGVRGRLGKERDSSSPHYAESIPVNPLKA